MIQSIPPQIKATGDVTAVGAAFLSFFKMVPWPEIAAFFAALYTLLRIIEWVWNVLKNKGWI